MNERKRILFVDDDELILACFERLLGRHFDLDVAAGGREALDALQKQGPYAAVVSDMRMPGMSGLELLSKARELCPQTVGVLLSGNAQFDDADDAIRNGTVFRLVQKPCPPPELIRILKEALTRYEAGATVREHD